MRHLLHSFMYVDLFKIILVNKINNCTQSPSEVSSTSRGEKKTNSVTGKMLLTIIPELVTPFVAMVATDKSFLCQLTCSCASCTHVSDEL